MADVNMRILLSAVGGGAVAGVFNDVAKSIGSGGLGGALAGIGVAAAAVTIGIGVSAVKAAGDFQAQTERLVTSAGELQSNLDMVRQGILQMSVDTATSTEQLSAGMYYVESSGYHAGIGLAVMANAARGAKSENADLDVVTKALTTEMVDYHMKAGTVAEATLSSASAMNGLIATVQNGKTNLQELASSMGSVLPIASSLGISFPQVAGSMDTMTNAGLSSRQAAQNLAHVLLALSTPSGVAVKSMHSVGLSAQGVKNALANQGLPEALQMIEDAVGKKFPKGSVEYETAIKNITGGITGFKLAAMLTGKSLDETKQNINKVAQSMKDGKNGVTGWTEVQSTFNFKMDQAKQALNAVMINIGTALLPVLSNLLTAVTPIITNFADWITKSGILQSALNTVHDVIQHAKDIINGTVTVVQNIVNWFQQWHQIILTVASVITAFFVPALIKTGVEAGIAGVKLAASFIANIVKSGVESVVNGAKIAAQFVANIIKAGVEGWTAAGKLGVLIGQFIASGVQAAIAGAKTAASWTANIIKSGVEAAIAGGKIAAQFVASMAQAAAQAVVAGAQIAAQFVATIIKAGVQAVITAGQFLGSLIPAIVSMAAEAVTAAITAIPGLIAGFIAWTAGAWAAAAATIAATWPILLIIAAIALLVVGIILLVTHWKQVSAFAEMIWGHIVKFFQDDVVKPIGNLFNQLGTKVHQIIQGIGGFFDGLGTKAHQVTTNVGNFFSNLGSTAHGIWDGAKQKAGDFFSWLGTQGHNATTGVGNAFSWLGTQVHDKINDIGGFFSWLGTQANNLLKTIQNITGGIGQAFQNAGKWIGDKINSAMQAVKNAINWVINGINNFINFLDGIRINIPAINVGPVHIGGGSIGLPHIPDIPLLAAGGNVTVGGLAVVGEAGPELIQMPAGAQVIPLNGGGAHPVQNGPTFNIYINTMARSQSEVNNLVNMIEQELGRRFRTQTPGYSVFSGAL